MEDRMTSKLVVNTIESDTGISSVSFASSISMSSTSKFFFGAAGIDIGADTNINRPEAGVLGFNINSSEKVRISSSGGVGIGTNSVTGNALTLGATGSIGAAVVCQNPTTSYGTNQGFYFGNGNGTIGYVWNYENDEIRFATYNTERLRIDAAGNMVLGNNNAATTNYGTNFQIHDSGTSGATLHLTTSQTGATNGDGFHLVQQGPHIYHWNRETGDQVFATGGIEKFRIDSSGHISQGGLTSPATTNGNIGRKYGIKSTANNIIIGETTQSGANYGLHIESRQTSRSGNARFAQIGLQNDSSGGGEIKFFTAASGADITERLRITSGGKIHSSNAVQSGGNSTGGFQFDAVDTACVLGIQQPSSAADTNAALQVWDGSSNNLRVNYSGLIKTSAGIDFSASSNTGGMTSEILDDYEEGTWTPSAVVTYNGSGSGSVSSSSVTGLYTKIGRQVTCHVSININASNIGGCNVGLDGLPFTISSSSVNFNVGIARRGIVGGETFVFEGANHGTTRIEVMRMYNNLGLSNGNQSIKGMFVYLAA